MFDKKTLENLRKKLKFSDPGIFEKTVCAVNLLQNLVKFYPDTIFKGGTSVLFHIFPPVRFSIDIDILLRRKNQKGLSGSLAELVSESQVFRSVEEDERESSIPKAHYKFYYDSHFTRNQQYVLLDIVFCEHSYHSVIEKKMKGHPLVLDDTNLMVKIPTIDGLCGDKMLAIAPKTTGFALNRKEEMEFVKQVVDLGRLFDNVNDNSDVRNTFINTAKQENKFRNTKHSEDKILNDIRSVAFKYSQHLLKGGDNSFREIEYINGGLKRVSNHLVSRYTQSDLKLAFAKIVYLCRIIEDNSQNKLINSIDFSFIKNRTLNGKYTVLEGLKKTNPQAYFYWVLALTK